MSGDTKHGQADVIPLRGWVPSEQRRRDLAPLGQAVAAIQAELAQLVAGVDWDAKDAEVKAARERAGARAERERTAHRADLMRDAGFPERALDCARGAGVNPDAAFLAAIRAWDTSRGNLCILSGPRDAGKTVAATWWTLRYGCGTTVAFARATTLIASSRYSRAERSVLLAADVLVLDDLGTEFVDAAGSALTDLDELFDVFYSRPRARLIVTTNVPGADFPKRYGGRIASRLREAGRWIELRAPSLRPQPKEPTK